MNPRKIQALFASMFCGFVASFSTRQVTTRHTMEKGSTTLKALHIDDSAEFASPLKLSIEDLERLNSMKTRQMTMPLLILDAMVPNQELSFESSDPKCVRLVQHCLETGSDVGMLGVNPLTGAPLSRGVTFAVDEDNLRINADKKSIVLTVRAGRRMEIQSEPFLDESGSFFLSDVELVDTRKEPKLALDQQIVANQLSETIPEAIKEWSQWVVKSGKTDQKGLDSRLEPLGPMPSELTARAFWVAAAINPLPALGVCLEIRPAMLSCTNDYERMVLACQAIRSSIDHMSGKRRLF